MLAEKERISARSPYPLEDWLLPVLSQQDPITFDFAAQAKLEKPELRIPEEIREHRDEYGFIGSDVAVLKLDQSDGNGKKMPASEPENGGSTPLFSLYLDELRPDCRFSTTLTQ